MSVVIDPSANSLAGQLALAVRIGGILFAIPIDSVEEVLPALPIEFIPQCPPYLSGVVSVRNKLIPILDAAERLGIGSHVRVMEPPIVCLRVAERQVGLEVDEAVDLIEVPRFERVTDEANVVERFISGLVEKDGQLIRILDVEGMLAHETVELAFLEQVATSIQT